MATARSAALAPAPWKSAADAATDAPAPRSRALHVLAAPAVGSRWRYLSQCLWSALAASLGAHRLDIGRARPCVTTYQLSATLAQNWRVAMAGGDERPASRRAPLGCNEAAGTLLQWQIFRDLGLNLRHVRQLSHRVQHPAGAAAVVAEGPQQVRSELQGAWRVGDGQALLVLRGEVRAALRGGPGQVVAQQEDRFLVSGLPARDLSALPCDRELSRELIAPAGSRRAPRVDPHATIVRLARITIEPTLGKVYAGLSGQFGALHARRVSGRRLAQATVAPMALRNLVAARLVAMGLALDQMQMHFESPVVAGQTLRLVCDGHVFELLDARFELVACGRI